MKTEEKILHYMEGTLSENESGELLHSLSVSPEKRVVLEQHIKLRELTSLAQKPLAVPQALEANMAERFPAIANYNRELAGGAAIIERAARPSYISRIAASLAGFIAQYPIRTGFAVAAASFIAYFAISGNNSSVTNPVTVAEQNVTNNQSPLMSNSSPATSTTIGLAKPLAASSLKQHRSGTDFSPSAHISKRTEIRSTETRSTEARSTEARSTEARTTKAHSTDSHNGSSNPEKLAVTPPEKTTVVNNKDVADAPKNIATPKNQDVKNEKTVENVEHDHEIPAKDIAVATPSKDVPSSTVSLAENNIHGSSEEQNPFKNKNENSEGFPFALRLYGSLGGSFVNVHENDNILAGRTEEAAIIGIDYIASSHWAIGVEGGNAAISELITQSAMQSSVNGLPTISRVVVNNVVTSGSQFYARAVVHYTFNPYDAFHFEGTVGAGIAFASSDAPLVSGALYLVHDFTQHFGISGGLAFAGAWTGSNAQNAAAQAASTGTDPIGYITTNHASGTLFTPSYAIRIGLKFKPW